MLIMNRLTALMPRPFGHVHLAWAILVVAGCVALATMGGGHPPPIVFVPPLLAAGFLGHLLLLLVAWLLGRGRDRVATGATATRRWPVELILIAIVLGLVSVASIAIAVGEIAKLWSMPLLWMTIAVVAVLHSAAFVLLLLRMAVARYLLAAIAGGWGVALLLQMREARGPGEWVLAVFLIAALAGIAAYVLRAQRIRSALS